MENNWFKNPGDLEDNKTSILGTSYFQSAGDLSPSKPNVSSYFSRPGDLDTPTQNNSFKFQEKEETIQSSEEIKEWLKTIVSGVKKSNYAFGEGLQATSSGKILVGLDELKRMVENGDNIISAEYLENMNMVDIEFESFRVPNKSR